MNESAMKRFWSKVNKGGPFILETQCWIWTAYRDADGYGRFRIDGQTLRAHRLSFEIKNGPISKGSVVRHGCDNPSCVNPEHLRSGSNLDNIMDGIQRGRFCHGERHRSAKLTKKQVLYIRSATAFYGYRVALMKKFGVSGRTIDAIRNRELWRHI